MLDAKEVGNIAHAIFDIFAKYDPTSDLSGSTKSTQAVERAVHHILPVLKTQMNDNQDLPSWAHITSLDKIFVHQLVQYFVVGYLEIGEMEFNLDWLRLRKRLPACA